MGTKDTNYSQLIGYLERRGISPKEAIEIIETTTPEGQKDNQKFNWKMLRLTLYLWERIEQDKKGHLWSKTDTCKAVVNSKNYKMLREPFHKERFDPLREENKLFKLVTDPRQKIAYFKTRYFKFKGKEKNVPQELINKLISGVPRK
jgi:hypothetical protein